MGHLKNGSWNNDDVATTDEDGAFQREQSEFRDTIAIDHPEFKPEQGRYHLYVSYACPWAHRTLIARKLKKLEDVVSVDVVHPHMLENSWEFRTDFEGATGDTVNGHDFLYQVYQQHDPQVTTKVTVPVLWDTRSQRIVNNESSEILRIFNSAFGGVLKTDSSDSESGGSVSSTDDGIDLYPEPLRKEIDEINELVYEPVNNGVYKTGFAKTQATYEAAYSELFTTLDLLEERLKERRYLVGEQLTEADIRLVTTLIRFDPVYYVHFKCNDRKISEFEALSRYLGRMMAEPAVRSTTNLEHIKQHYYYSHDFLNPHRIVPLGPRATFAIA